MQARQALGAWAMPPCAVSRRLAGSAAPTLRMTEAISSKGTSGRTPESASWADENAAAVPMALRAWQGTSTRPPTGSHARPRRFARVSDAASSACSGVPPKSCTSAAAAMAAALPTSAWQPPSAPETLAFNVRMRPMAAAA